MGKPTKLTKTIKQTLEYRRPEWHKLTEQLFSQLLPTEVGSM